MSKETKQLRADLATKVAELEAIVAAAASESREFTPAESESRGRLTLEIKQFEDKVNEADAAKREARKQEKAALARMGYPGYELNDNGGSLKVTNEHRTYEKGNGTSYLKDLCVVGFGPGAMGGSYFPALERLQRHSMENHVEAVAVDAKWESQRSDVEKYFLAQNKEARNPRIENRGEWYSYRDAMNTRALSTTTGAGGEFVPPLFMTVEWIMFMRAARALADCQHHENLPDGTMSINIPKATGGTSVASQNTQNTGVSNTDMQTAFVTFPVVTKAGEQLISLQLLERSPIAFDQMTFMDLGKAYAQAVDVAVAAGNGTASGSFDINGGTDVVGILNTVGINTVTWTQASPVLQGLYGQVGLAKADVSNTLFLPATHAFMTPTRWEWISQSFDTSQRPVVVPTYQGPFNATVLGTDAAMAEGALGRRFNGLDTYEDANIPQTVNTNQDLVLVGRMDENWLFESPIVTRVLPQTYGSQLSVLLQCYGYIAYTAARYPNANSVITGTGLVYPPSFNS